MTDSSVQYFPVLCSLFTTCPYKCGYCSLAENGSVRDVNQLAYYRDKDFLGRIISFFNSRVTDDFKWHLQLTGGEPLLMPNFRYFCDEMFAEGNKISLYTALYTPPTHRLFQYILTKSKQEFDYLMVSYHPEAESDEDGFFEKIKILKENNHNVIVRFVAHPRRLDMLENLENRCRAIDVSFYVNNLITKTYPHAYSDQERDHIAAFMSSFSQITMLNGGVDTTGVLCNAGRKHISIDLISGNITPCIQVTGPSLGNLHRNTLRLNDKPELCPRAGIDCNCDVHFNEELPLGIEGKAIWEAQKKGFVEPLTKEMLSEQTNAFLGKSLKFCGKSKITGQVDDDNILIFSDQHVKEQYVKWKEKYYRPPAESDTGQIPE